MIAKCIKADPLGWLKVGKIYHLTKLGRNYYIEGEGFAVEKDNLNEMFEEVNPGENFAKESD